MITSSEEVENGKEVNQGEVPTPVVVVAPALVASVPVLVVNSNWEVVDDLGFSLSCLRLRRKFII